jgi:hypothetical protein
VGVAVPFPVGRYDAGPLLPVQAGERVDGDWAKGLACPQRLHLGGVLAEPAGPVVHCLGEFVQVPVQAGGASGGHLLGRGLERLRLHAVEHVPYPRVQDAGDVAGACHGPRGHSLTENPDAIEPGSLGLAQSPPQPRAGGVIEGLAGEVGGQGAPESALVPGGLGAAGYVIPDSAQHTQVVGTRQFSLEGLGRRQLAGVSGEDPGEHCYRIYRE